MPFCGCWIWVKSWYLYGYGKLYFAGEIYAHRVSYKAFKGDIPEGFNVCHTCDTPPCVNPDHLFLGTKANNSADMVAKGRQTKGEKRPNAKLRETQVREILTKDKTGLPQPELARYYGVTKSTISSIVRGKRWKYIYKEFN